MATFNVQQRIGSAWDQVGKARSWQKALTLIGPDPHGPGWLLAEADVARIHLRKDAEWRIVETGFGKEEPPPVPVQRPEPERQRRHHRRVGER